MSFPEANPAPAQCFCWLPDGEVPCACSADEKAMRFWACYGATQPMSAAQRAWCLDEIGSVEGYERSDYEGAPDSLLAQGVLHARSGYCRDKGLL